jgi:hypothetical protein
MGFGYNPDLARFGERLDILNFFSWMRTFQESLGSAWTIFDASGYAIVNKTPQKKIKKLGDKPTSEQILDALVSEQDRPKRAEVMRNCELRSQYLQRLVEVVGIQADYIDSRKVFRESRQYKEALDVALEFVERLKIEDADLVDRICPPNPNPASKLYLPLEVAEAIYLWEIGKVAGKFGPTTEEDFDRAILGALEKKAQPYETLRCSFGPRKPGYLSDRNVIWTQSPDTFVNDILETDQEYLNFVAQYLDQFRGQDESVKSCAMRMRDRMKLEEVL